MHGSLVCDQRHVTEQIHYLISYLKYLINNSINNTSAFSVSSNIDFKIIPHNQ